jgi:hypothetical protein
MRGKHLGKIKSAEYGYSETNDKMCLYLNFTSTGGDIYIGLDVDERKLLGILNDARVYFVSSLKNKPIELVIDENNTFSNFRILTEVL